MIARAPFLSSTSTPSPPRRILTAAWLIALTILHGCGGVVTVEEQPEGCDPLSDASGPTTVEISLRNATDQPLYLELGCDSLAPLSIRDSTQNPIRWHQDACTLTCEQAQRGDPGCIGECEAPASVHIDPGGTFPLLWDGAHLVETSITDRCWADDLSPTGTCLRREPVADGPYEIVAAAYPNLNCALGTTCECDAKGSYCSVDRDANLSGIQKIAKAQSSAPFEEAFQVTLIFR